MGLAAIMAVSAMSISAFAANIPMRSEVDTKAASADNPVTYRCLLYTSPSPRDNA